MERHTRFRLDMGDNTGGAVLKSTKKVIVSFKIAEEELDKKLKTIVTDNALYHEPTNLVVAGIRNLLVSLNEEE